MASPLRQHLPNALTLLRLFLAVACLAALSAFHYPDRGVLWANLGIALFILAAITDALDGALARKWNVVSTFGRIMDPFCDQILVLGAFVVLAGPNFVWNDPARAGDPTATPFFPAAVHPWMVVVILARELLVTAVRSIIESKGVAFPSRWSGKWKMILQSIVIPIVVFLAANFEPHDTPWALWTARALVYLTLIVTVWSGIPYVTGARAILSGSSESPAPADPTGDDS